MSKSAAEAMLAVQLRADKITGWQTEYEFAKPDRKWRLDYAWPQQKVAVEIEGGVFVQGRHSRGVGMEKDMEKYAEALVRGWKVLRVTPRHVKQGKALEWIKQALRPLSFGDIPAEKVPF
jgi:very-short-patch-repair endonuclease